jgi:hypothetical protein
MNEDGDFFETAFSISSDPAVMARNIGAAVEEMERTRPGRPKPFQVQVFAVLVINIALASAVPLFAGLGVRGIVSQANPTSWISSVSGWTILSLSIALGCAYGLRVHHARVDKYDEENATSMDFIKFRERKLTPPAQPMIIANNGQEQIRIGKYIFAPREWVQLARALERNDWKVTRRVLADSGLFTNINVNYQAELTEFSRLGWLPEGSKGNDKLTDDGIAFFRQALSPSPAGNNAPVVRDATDRDHNHQNNQGWESG